jgi:SOS-response transcriptional repressor LexA
MSTPSLQQRVLEILREQELKQTELAVVAGVTKALVNQWVSGIAKSMSYDAATRIASRFPYNVDWLIKGRTPKLSKNRTTGKNNVSAGPDIQLKAPLISWVQAGKFTEPGAIHRVGEPDVQGFYMPKKAGKNVYCLRVEGDSMTAPYGRSYPAGSIIFVDPDQRSPSNGARVIAKLNGSEDVTFKALVIEAGKTFLKPLNPQHPAIMDHFKVIGTVIGKWEDD